MLVVLTDHIDCAGPAGPMMPVLTSLMEDMRALLATPILPKAGPGQAMGSLMEVYHRVRTAQGDNR